MALRVGEIIAIGSEMLHGGRTDTNSVRLTPMLGDAGVEVRYKTVVGDREKDIALCIKTAAARAEVIVLTGGLGPTQDDCTRQAVARVTARPLRLHRDALRQMEARLKQWSRTPTKLQRRQGLIPRGAEVLANPVGSAPGFLVRWRRCLIAALPGVPAEAERMCRDSLVPHLVPRTRRDERIVQRVWQTVGATEGEIDQRLEKVLPRRSGLKRGLLASPLGVQVSLTGSGAKAEALLARWAGRIRKALGPSLYAEGEETMEQVVGRLLRERKLTVALAESCTGGLIGHRLTQVPGSSAYMDRGAVCYSNRAKTEMLGVPVALLKQHGAVSAPVAEAMAKGIRMRSRASIGLSVTGIAGPGGGTATKPVGLVYIGLSARGEKASRTQEFRFHGSRDVIKLRASQAALNILRKWLLAT